MLRTLWRWLRLPVFGLIVLLLVLAAPIAYVETMCTAPEEPEAYVSIITDGEQKRVEANSFLTYPEWHIVYAYEDLASEMKTGDEYKLDYFSSVAGFWSSFCALNKMSNRHGGADFNTRSMVHTIGASFTLEMGLKALYEETLGRLFGIIRGSEKTPQDQFALEMAHDYAEFLLQQPWYKYDFETAVDKLWAQPVGTPSAIRGWERRLALGGEWKAKAAYADVIAEAVKAAGEAKLTIRSVVGGLSHDALSAIDGITIIEELNDSFIIETPRYREFTRILQEVAAAGGSLVEIAGNDDIMLSVIQKNGTDNFDFDAVMIARMALSDGTADRLLVGTKTNKLFDLFAYFEFTDRRLEHIYDY